MQTATLRGAIHQPYFLPWLGYFHKISLVSDFIYFDNVQMPNMKFYLSRVQVLLNNEPYWLSVPIIRKHDQIIKDVRINDQENWRKKHLGTIRQAYLKSPFFNELYPDLVRFYENRFEFVSDFDIELISLLAKKLGLQTTFHKASERVPDNTLKATEMIIAVCNAFNIRHYVAGKGPSLEFLEPEQFREAGINIEFQEFLHPVYPQNHLPFTGGLSAIDAIFALGYSKTGSIIKEINNIE
jgi:hypothetical protein